MTGAGLAKALLLEKNGLIFTPDQDELYERAVQIAASRSRLVNPEPGMSL